MNKIIKVLYVNGGTMDMGGISSYMMNYYRHLDKTKVQIDFVVHGKKSIYDDEIQKTGGKIMHVPTKRENYLKNRLQLFKIMKAGNYQIIHCHMDAMNGMVLKLAQRAGIKIRISHSHNTNYLTNNKVKVMFHEVVKKEIPHYATQLWACSEAAGRWLYGRKNFEVIPNAIEITKFKFDENSRDVIRKKLNIEGKYVIGHVGKFEYQKNHDFLIEIFADIASYKPNAVLVLVGDGSKKEIIEKKVRDLKLTDRVIFLGKRTDVNEILNAFDVFVMPSHYEGLPVVAVEAQTNGLKCVCSDTITKEINITGNVIFIGLTECIEKWRNAICTKQERDRNAVNSVIEHGYSICDEAKELERRYIKLAMEANE